MKYIALVLSLFSAAFSICTGPKFLGKIAGSGKGIGKMTVKRISRGSIGGQIGQASGEILKQVIKAFGGGTPFGDDDGDGQVVEPETFAAWSEDEITDPDLATMLTGTFEKRINSIKAPAAAVKNPDEAGELLRKTYVPLVYDIVRLLKMATSTKSSDQWSELIRKLEPVREQLVKLVQQDNNVAKKYPWISTINGFVSKLTAIKTNQPIDGAKAMASWMQKPENGKNFFSTDKSGFVRVPGVMPPEFPTPKLNLAAMLSAKKMFHKSGYKPIPQPKKKK